MSTTQNAVPQGIQVADVEPTGYDLVVSEPFDGDVQRVMDSFGNASALYLSTPKVQVGSDQVSGAFQALVEPTDANSTDFIIGNTSRSNLRLGAAMNYSWVQSHGGKPLQLNPLGNDVLIGLNRKGNVGIGTESPQATLEVNGSVSATSLNVTGMLSASTFYTDALTVPAQGLRITAVPSATTAPNGGSSLKVLFVDPATGSLYAL
jgi:hypothetical protein